LGFGAEKLNGDYQRVRTVWEVREIVVFRKGIFENRLGKEITTSEGWRVYRDVRNMITLFIVQHKDWRECNNCCISPSK
jgi:hypothetical protein